MKTSSPQNLKLNTVESFLFDRLPDVVQLEKTMGGIRRKYNELWEIICNRVKDRHPELDHRIIRVIDSYAQTGMGRKCWPSQYSTWPSGIYIWDIKLECLCSEDQKTPSAGIWIKPPENLRVNLVKAKEQIYSEANRLLKLNLKEERGAAINIWYDLPESRQGLLNMLIKNDGREFIKCMVSHFDSLSSLIPAINQVYGEGKRARKL